MPLSPAEQIAAHLRNGEHDSSFAAWPGASFLARAANGDAALRRALLATVHARTSHASVPPSLAELDVTAFARAKVLPMVQALFSRHEQPVVLELLARSVVFLTPTNIDAVLQEARWLSTAWDLANLYLASCGARLLSDDAPAILGLRATRTREWLLPLDYRQRETFAYACDSYSRILELGRGGRARQALLEELEDGSLPADSKVDPEEYVDILRKAVAARNGFKRILRRCAPLRKGSAE